MNEAIVIGCGVSGLSSAIRLQEAGYKVTILTRDLPAETTSSVAAAIWYPYRAFPLDRVMGWSRVSLDAFYRLMDDPRTGVSPLTIIQPFDAPAPEPWWRDLMRRFERATAADLPPGMMDGYQFEVPLIETPIYLRYLWARFERDGGQVRREEVADLWALSAKHRLIVNCTGVWAGRLAADDEVFPIRGQVVRVAGGYAPDSLLTRTGLFHEPHDAQPVYSFPRSDGIILGGTVEEGEWETEPDPATTADIIARVRALLPHAGELAVLETAVGLRPGRREVRLGREQVGETLFIHNYGHGGAGFTLSWGCADEVVLLARQGA